MLIKSGAFEINNIRKGVEKIIIEVDKQDRSLHKLRHQINDRLQKGNDRTDT